MKNTSFLVTFVSLLTLVGGCTLPESTAGDSYSRSSARQGYQTRIGTIINIDQVKLAGEQSGAGSIGGGVLGGAVGSTMGGGRGHLVGAAAGAVVGALAGAAAEKAATSGTALEISVQYPDGTVDAIVQEPGSDVFVVGQQVRVLINGSEKRVRPAPAGMVPAAQ